MAVTIDAGGLSKRYRLGQPVADTVADAFRTVLHRRRTPADYVWALRDVDLQVREGEVVRIIGRNGAGKSTLLKILARITDPSAGWARTRARVGALLEVGTAFHLELTGRENIHINGALLGMSASDIRRRFDEIVEFSGVGRFLDTPLKRYSSGMYLRLAFAVAAHFEPEIVVVDEVLAVGDAEFQRRCLGQMSELGSEGRTVIFVSHDLGAIGRLCSRAIWLDAGCVRGDGPTADIVARYYAEAVPFGTGQALAAPSAGHAPVALREMVLTGASGARLDAPTRGEPFAIKLVLDVREPQAGLEVAVWVVNEHGMRILDEALFDQAEMAGALDGPGAHEATVSIAPVLPAGTFTVGVWLGSRTATICDEDVLRFQVQPRVGDPSEMSRRPRATSPAVAWHVGDGAVR
jgi:ABC-type polysaccharide/polyol phosphate transport system ATPase subunit